MFLSLTVSVSSRSSQCFYKLITCNCTVLKTSQIFTPRARAARAVDWPTSAQSPTRIWPNIIRIQPRQKVHVILALERLSLVVCGGSRTLCLFYAVSRFVICVNKLERKTQNKTFTFVPRRLLLLPCNNQPSPRVPKYIKRTTIKS